MKDDPKLSEKTVAEWIKFADENFNVAGHELEYESPACHTVCFLCQGSAEKYLKAYLISKGWELKKTHDIVELLEYCSDYDERFDQLIEDGRILNDYIIEGRYPGDISFETIGIEQAKSEFYLTTALTTLTNNLNLSSSASLSRPSIFFINSLRLFIS